MVYKVVLRLEGDEWRIDDVHAGRPRPTAKSPPPSPDAAGEKKEEPKKSSP